MIDHDSSGIFTRGAARPADAVVVACSESAASTALITRLDPLCAIQTLGAQLGGGVDPGELGSLQYALSYLGVRRVILVGHAGCHVAARRGAPDAPNERAASQLHLALALLRLERHPLTHRAVERGELKTHALWFDEDHALYAYTPSARGFQRLDERARARLFEELRGDAEPAGWGPRLEPVG